MTDTPTDTPSNAPTDTPAASLRLQQFPEKLAVVHLGPGADVPGWAASSSIFSVTATATETSLVCAGRDVPTKVVATRGLTGFATTSDVDAAAPGLLVGLLGPLADAGIAVHVVTTHRTAWVLVPVTAAERVAEAWRRRGYVVDLAVPVPPSRPSRKQKS